MNEIKLTSFINWLRNQKEIECPVRDFITWWGRCEGYRVSGVWFERDSVSIMHRYAYTTSHSIDPELLKIRELLPVGSVEQALELALSELMKRSECLIPLETRAA